ncbi:MAG TPA: sulfite oxidase [Candidatus Dormibacteraeota bacterium]|nr:sulfite oxidase [Candidatus Dormibacteraeota bacterium]
MSPTSVLEELIRSQDPLNAETSIQSLTGVAMPTEAFYARNHFQMPVLDPTTWRLHVGGLVQHPTVIRLRDLLAMPSHTEVVTLECAGNGRSFLNPKVDGEQWRLGAVSTAEWTGVQLVEVLERAGIKSAGSEIVFRGADAGAVKGRVGTTCFERSLNLDEARNSGAILAYAMNGEALPPRHGYPLRLIVPLWYGVASVKWLTEIDVIDRPFDGFFQTERYVYEWERDGRLIKEPVTLQRVRALITQPRPDQPIEPGDCAIRGLAWSGAAPIARVDVSVGGGAWQEARLLGEGTHNSWQRWELATQLRQPGPNTVRARATDLAGRTQPEVPEWNRLGYGSNAIQVVPIRVL